MERYDELIAEARAIHDLAASEERDLTEEEQAKFDELMAEAEKIKAEMEREETIVDGEEFSKRSKGRFSRPIHAPKEKTHRYSLLRAIHLSAQGKQVDGYEGEVSQEIAKKMGKEAQGFYMPSNLPVQTFDLNTTTGAGAVPTIVDATNFVEMLRNKMLVQQLGARVLTDMQGNYSLPKQTGGASAYWVTEGNAPTEGNSTIGQVPFTPKTVGAYVDMTRKFILQSSVDAEKFCREDLATSLALEIDRAALNGSGEGAEPEGLLQNSSVTAHPTGANAVTFADLVELETIVSAGNADLGNLAYLTTSAGRGAMKVASVGSNTDVKVWHDNKVNGYDAYASNQMPSDLVSGSSTGLSSVLFGNWADLIISFWGGIDILVDPYTASSSGTVRVVALQDCDIKPRHDESFAKIVDLYTVA